MKKNIKKYINLIKKIKNNEWNRERFYFLIPANFYEFEKIKIIKVSSSSGVYYVVQDQKNELEYYSKYNIYYNGQKIEEIIDL